MSKSAAVAVLAAPLRLLPFVTEGRLVERVLTPVLYIRFVMFHHDPHSAKDDISRLNLNDVILLYSILETCFYTYLIKSIFTITIMTVLMT